MKKLFSWLMAALVVLAAGCSESFDDSGIWNKLNEHSESIKDHEQRILALEELCKQLNTNISALQTLVEALQERDYITAITPINKDGEIVGYTISFAQSDSITIYFDQSGNGGIAIQPKVPQIGVRQDSDGLYYWTVDGEWLLDEHGNKVKAVGEDGRDGENGEDGKDGITPRLKIENEYWYISYDEGKTWEELGKATGEDGEDGKDGKNADCIFRSITQDEAYVYFHLNDGTTIAIAKNGGSNGNPGGDTPDDNNSIEHMSCADNEILYTTKYGYPIELAVTTGFGGSYQSNTYENGVGRIKFDNDVTVIPANAFENLTSITQIKLPQALIKIEQYAFSGCDGLTAFYGKFASEDNRCWIMNGVIKAFAPSGLTEYTIPDNVTSIGDGAFHNCTSLTSITIPDGVTSIGVWAFVNCTGLTSITIGNGVTSIGNTAFIGCTGKLIVYCNIPSNDSIYGAFYSSKFTEVLIGDGVTSIGDYAFYSCTSLTSVTISDSVTSIGYRAFIHCTSLTSVTIGSGVTEIGDAAFYGCEGLTSVYCKPVTPPTGGFSMFDQNASGRKIYVPNASVNAYKENFYWSDYASKIEGYDFK